MRSSFTRRAATTARTTAIAAETATLIAERVMHGLEPADIAMHRLAVQIVSGGSRTVTVDRALLVYTKSSYISPRNFRPTHPQDAAVELEADSGVESELASEPEAVARPATVTLDNREHHWATAKPPLQITMFPVAVLAARTRPTRKPTSKHRYTPDPDREIIDRLVATTVGRVRHGAGEAGDMMNSICRAYPYLRERFLSALPRTLLRRIDTHRQKEEAAVEVMARLAALSAKKAAAERQKQMRRGGVHPPRRAGQRAPATDRAPW